SSLKPGESVLVRYSLGYADWRLARAPKAKKEEQMPLHEEAIDQLRKALKIDPKNAEALGLLAAVYGSQMGLVPALGMELGQKASELMDQAIKIAPNNPRLAFFRPPSAFPTPPPSPPPPPPSPTS